MSKDAIGKIISWNFLLDKSVIPSHSSDFLRHRD